MFKIITLGISTVITVVCLTSYSVLWMSGSFSAHGTQHIVVAYGFSVLLVSVIFLLREYVLAVNSKCAQS